MNLKTIAIIMARGGSKGLKGKNLKLLNGKPLIAYTIKDALDSGVCDTVLVTSDDDEIIKVSKKFGATVSFKRPPELAKDDVPPEPVIQHALTEHEKITKKKFDIVVYLQPTDIFRPKNVIKDCVDKLSNNPKLDTVFSAYKTHKHFWKKNEDNSFRRITDGDYDARQKRFSATFREDQGVASAFKAHLIRDEGIRVGKNIDIVQTDDFRTAVDIHYDFDFWLAETLKLKEQDSSKVFKDEFLGKDSKFWTQSIYSVALNKQATGYTKSYKADVAAIAKVNLYPGDILDGEGGYKVKGKLVSSLISYKKDLLPLGLSDNIKVIKPITKNSFISFDDVENNLDREIIKVREYQFQLLEK